LAVAAVAVTAVAFLALRPDDGTSGDGGEVVAWATLGTADVHSLAFDPTDTQHLYFGHHGGLLESRDGGRDWAPTTLEGVDAMNVEIAGAGRLQIAGHEVYVESSDGGQSWAPVPNDLPGLDLHAFAMDPADPQRVWAFAVGFGLFESSDGGRRWEQRQPGNWPALAAFHEGGETILAGISDAGLQRSADGGRSWSALGSPPAQPITLAAATDGSALYLATANGLYRSADGGSTWDSTAFGGVALALAVATDDPSVVGLVDEETRFYRSSDGGSSFSGPP
jgi:photosystem II stability/assembly factor-like uncharacterized protein